MKTNIPLTEFNQIIQIKSSPETIVSLLNEMENLYSKETRHFNTKRIYPFWKVCLVCKKPFPTSTREQAIRNKTCSRECINVLLKKRKSREITFLEEKNCELCGKTFLSRKKRPSRYCSTVCNGKIRSISLVNYIKENPIKWTEERKQKASLEMKGEKNRAWKGGVTYFKRKGLYADQNIKYLKCPIEFLKMARKDGYVSEYRLIVAKILNRPLLREEVVHHINHNAEDNRIENLMLFKTNADHKKYEAGQPIKPLWQP